MLWSLVCMVLGVAVWLVPDEARPAVMLLALSAGAMYVRSMHKRARSDVR